MAASFLLFVSAAVGLAGGDETADPRTTSLLARGWVSVDHLECPSPSPGSFFEVSGEQGSAEVLALKSGFLASRAPLPEPPYECRQIHEPHFVEEI
jgi:hypothetical protein